MSTVDSPQSSKISTKRSRSPQDHDFNEDIEQSPSGPPVISKDGQLHRGLSTRQVSMMTIAGTIGTGLFLGTGRSLAQGGPASILLCYGIIGIVVYVTLLLLGEMATQYPVAGK